MSQRSRYSFDLFLPANSSHRDELAPFYGGGVGAVGYPGSVAWWAVNWSNIVPFNDLGPNAKFNCSITGTGYVLPHTGLAIRGLDAEEYMPISYAIGLGMSGIDITSKPMETVFGQQLVAPLEMLSGERVYFDTNTGDWTLPQEGQQTLQYKVQTFNMVVRNPSALGDSKLYFTPVVKSIRNDLIIMDGDGGQTISYHLQFDLIATE